MHFWAKSIVEGRKTWKLMSNCLFLFPKHSSKLVRTLSFFTSLIKIERIQEKSLGKFKKGLLIF